MNRRETLQNLVTEAGRGGLTFPTSAMAMMRIHQALDDPDCSTESIARQIKVEPLLSARVVALANSVAYNRSGRMITDVKTAVTLLGFRAVKMLATVMITRLMAAGAQLPAHRKLAASLWEHTAHVAALAQLLARRVTNQDAETALFAGMLHEIGGFYLVYRAAEFPGLLDGSATDWIGGDEDDIEHTPERDIGRALFKSLGVPEPVVSAIEMLWQGYLAFPPTSLGDTLLLAYQLSPVRSPLREAAIRSDEDIHASIDMVVGKETLQEILRESAQEVASLIGAL